MRRTIVLLALGLLALPAGAHAATTPLGQVRAAAATTATASGIPRAISARARTSATVNRLHVLLGRRSRARLLVVGLYADAGGHPGRLLASGSRRSHRYAGWQDVPIRKTAVVAGRRYWLAVLGRYGILRTRAARGFCSSELSRAHALRKLAPHWTQGPRSSRCAMTVAARARGASAGTPAPAPAVPLGAALAPGMALHSPSQAIVNAAIARPFIRYGRQYSGGADVNDGWGGGAPMVLAIASYAGNTTADARLLAQARDTIAGGNEPVANGGYPAQHERWVTGMYAVMRHTPRIWNQLSAAERNKIDLLMTGALVASAFTTSDHNPHVQARSGEVTLDGDTDLSRDYNPNYQEGMIGMMLVGEAYFGGAAQAQAVLDSWNHDAFVAALKAAGFSNMAATFTWKADHPSSPAPDAATIEQAVRNYSYYGLTLAQPMSIARKVTLNTYGATVSCGLNGGAGISTSSGPAGVIVGGCAGLPNKGSAGQLLELDGADGGGPRSSALYGYEGFECNQVNHLVMEASGLWQAGADASAILARLKIGVPDLWYKLAQGYRGYASGSLQYIPDAPSPGVLRDDNANFSFPFQRSLWDDVVRPADGL